MNLGWSGWIWDAKSVTWQMEFTQPKFTFDYISCYKSERTKERIKVNLHDEPEAR